MSNREQLQKIKKRITVFEGCEAFYVPTSNSLTVLDGLQNMWLADCLNSGIALLFAHALADIRFLLSYIHELELETITTRVSCDGCGLGFRPRELYKGNCAKCWATQMVKGELVKVLAQEWHDILAEEAQGETQRRGLDDAF